MVLAWRARECKRSHSQVGVSISPTQHEIKQDPGKPGDSHFATELGHGDMLM